MAKKRKPGAGRKPRGEFHRKTKMITTRVTPETRMDLDRAAKKSGRSLSQEIEARLRVSIEKVRSIDSSHQIRALGEAVMLVARYIERATEKHWHEDAFTGQAVRQGCEFLISHFAPRGTPITPVTIAQAAARSPGPPPMLDDAQLVANSVGFTEAGKVISMIESWGYRSFQEEVVDSARSTGHYFPEEWRLHELLFRELGSGWERAKGKEKRR